MMVYQRNMFRFGSHFWGFCQFVSTSIISKRSANKSLWGSSPLTWKHCHVKGYQDRHSPSSPVDIYSRLNIEMDFAAKQHLQVARCTPRHYYTIHEPWSIWSYGIKLNGPLDDRLYEIAHAATARAYGPACHHEHIIWLCA
jgi:hypothetical protein